MKIKPSIVCEEVGDDVVVLDSQSQSVVSVSGVGGSVIKRMLAGEPVGKDEPGVSELVDQGILVTEESNTVSRRTLMVSGAAMGAGGIVALSLPGVAMASSIAEALPAPLFDANVTGLNRAEYDGDSAFIYVEAIANFDGSLSYEFRLAGETEYFQLEKVTFTGSGKDVLQRSYAGSTLAEADIDTVDGAAFLRARSSDGRVSADTSFTFEKD